MLRFLPAVLVAGLAVAPALADEFTDTLDSAIKAYNDGDVAGAQQDVEYAGKLLTAMKAEGLAKFLPAAQDGWTRADQNVEEAGGVMAMIGGGQEASAGPVGHDTSLCSKSLPVGRSCSVGLAEELTRLRPRRQAFSLRPRRRARGRRLRTRRGP